jgi:drug/metabolite transporter (DMT)-like permease
MDFRPAPGQDSPGYGAIAALCATQFGVALIAGFVFALLPGGGSGLGAVAPLTGAMGYAVWAEGKAPGCLSPRLTRRLALRATVVSLAISAPYVVFLARAAEQAGGRSIPAWAWVLILAFAGLLSFLITWFGLAQGRRIQESARRRKSGGA